MNAKTVMRGSVASLHSASAQTTFITVAKTAVVAFLRLVKNNRHGYRNFSVKRSSVLCVMGGKIHAYDT